MADNEKRAEEAIKLVSDWGKWIVTLELAVIGAIGALFSSSQNVARASIIVRIFGTITVATFLVSIAAAAIMLLGLPEIMQQRRSGDNVWSTSDTAIRIRIETLAFLGALFFGLGVTSGCAMIVALAWI